MSQYFTSTRNIELSTIDYLETSLNADWSGIAVVKGFTQAYKEKLPVVAIRLLRTGSTRKEVGNYDLRNVYTLVVDIFATSDGMRLDVSDYILNKLKLGYPYYEFSKDSGNNQDLVKTQNGRVNILEFLENTRVEFGTDVETHDRFRHTLSFNVRR